MSYPRMHMFRGIALVLAIALLVPAAYASQDITANKNMVSHFAAAYMKIKPIWKQMDQRIRSASTDAKRKKISQASARKQTKVIRSEGLTIKQFNAFITKINRDKTFKAEVKKKIAQLRTQQILGTGGS